MTHIITPLKSISMKTIIGAGFAYNVVFVLAVRADVECLPFELVRKILLFEPGKKACN